MHGGGSYTRSGSREEEKREATRGNGRDQIWVIQGYTEACKERGKNKKRG